MGPRAMGTSGGPEVRARSWAKTTSRPTSAMERGVTAILTISAPISAMPA